ncbi:MAG: hypothetical protein IJR19_02615, partial [Lachnospiraceae bacterium]|nr:hypothetical protein [Lachnospiraceae bacterium]
KIVDKGMVDSASINTGDGGCKLTVKVSKYGTVNPFAEYDGPYVTVSCTYEGKAYTSTWTDDSIFNVIVQPTPTKAPAKKPTPTPAPSKKPAPTPTPTPKPTPTLTPAQEKVINQVTNATPALLPDGIIEHGTIRFKAYNDQNLPITGYEYAVKEGSKGEWKTVKSKEQKVSMSSQFPKLKTGETYWYKYRYYVTVNGKDYYSNWTGGEMGDVYTIYD